MDLGEPLHGRAAQKHLDTKKAVVHRKPPKESFARIHAANLINAGILPLTFENPDDYDALQPGARLRIDDIRTGMAAGKLTLTDTAAGKSYPVVCSLTERQQAILLAGGLLNYTKEHAL